MKRLIIAPFLVLFIFYPIFPQDRGLNVSSQNSSPHSEKRVALVIGNSAYKDMPLLNPVNDARDIAYALAELGFEVIHKDNLTRTEIINAIRAFGERINKAEVALFYYAGHGMQVDGRNWLIPVEANVSHEYEVEYESVDAGRVMDTMQDAKSRLNIVILDACRNNPFARSFRSANRGLAVMNAPTGTIIAYATAPGAVASDGDKKNGLYTQELLKVMRIPDLKIEELFKKVRISIQNKTAGKQIPWESSSLIGDFFFLRNTTAEKTEIATDEKSVTATNDAGDRLEIISIDPPSPSVIPIGISQDVVVKVAYELRSTNQCRIWVQPIIDNTLHPNGNWQPSLAIQNGKGIIIRSFGLDAPGQVDHIRVMMGSDSTKMALVSLMKEVRYYFVGKSSSNQNH